MNKIKEWNRVTLTLFVIGLILFAVTDGVSKMPVVYALIMTIYFLASELFEFHLWDSSESKRNQLNYLINEMDEQKKPAPLSGDADK